jgi:hypothetical protein
MLKTSKKTKGKTMQPKEIFENQNIKSNIQNQRNAL